MNRVPGRDYLRRLSLPRGAARLALLIAAGAALMAPAMAAGEPASPVGPSATLGRVSATTGGAPSAPTVGAIIYSQMDTPATAFPYDITSQDFETNLDTSDAEAADDFVVPANGTWTVDGVGVDGEYRSSNGQNPAPLGFHVRFWSNNPTTGLPANMIAERLQQTYTNGANPGDVTISVNPPVALTAGTYWVSVQARLDFGDSTRTYQWYWHHRITQSNNGAAWRNPGNYHQTGCIQFSRRATCQNSTASPDQLFQLFGSATAGPPPPPPPPPVPPPVRCHVPNVTGQTLIRARPIIVHAHCRVGHITYMLVRRRRRGRVLGQNPHAGHVLPRNSAVNLLVGH